ncbi:hypothetical protein [Brenneria tiliae]|uniref:Uncharacterized protein n=1 Tax=Brenneria tiliae TaxID=2914984 RepID=A0ABT0MNI3_9GAMM|nr:hypothetical protein [Brenneria tiliae]MCL2891404.1 hypothetical protein [Brenneria tiliae]MCL2897137.1 hypothetical protein [Brenneria tiliae]MCL2904790.1 hypothetical protein [Brenneria tiliae]
MNKLILPPNGIVKSNNVIKPVQIDLEKEEPELSIFLKQLAEAEKSLADTLALSSWYRSGLGPRPTSGGFWVAGSTLAPLGSTPTGVVDHIDYNYDRNGFGNWTSQISVRMVISNAAGTQSWTADLTASGSDTIVTTGANIPANCRLTLQMKVGNLTGGLFNPPYIDGYDCTVFYS